jgi:hypothetical protein
MSLTFRGEALQAECVGCVANMAQYLAMHHGFVDAGLASRTTTSLTVCALQIL